MNHLNHLNSLNSLILTAGCTFLLVATAPVHGDAPAAAPAVAAATATEPPRAVDEILLLQPFTLDQPFEFEWRAERPQVASGWIVVLAVDPALVRPRQVAEPVVYVGSQTAERLNIGERSGRLVLIVPAPLDDARQVAPLTKDAPIFFGSPMLPEQVDADTVAREVVGAKAAGIATASPTALTAARSRGGEELHVADRSALLAAAAKVVRRFAPDEAERAQLLEGKPLAEVAQPGGNAR